MISKSFHRKTFVFCLVDYYKGWELDINLIGNEVDDFTKVSTLIMSQYMVKDMIQHDTAMIVIVLRANADKNIIKQLRNLK